MARPFGSTIALAALLAAAQPVLAQQGPVGAFADTAVRDLVGASVTTAEGHDVGEIERVIALGSDVMAVVGVGGFLGFGEHDVALPLGDFEKIGDGLTLEAYTEFDLRSMIEWPGDGMALPLDAKLAGDPAHLTVPATRAETPATPSE